MSKILPAQHNVQHERPLIMRELNTSSCMAVSGAATFRFDLYPTVEAVENYPATVVANDEILIQNRGDYQPPNYVEK